MKMINAPTKIVQQNDLGRSFNYLDLDKIKLLVKEGIMFNEQLGRAFIDHTPFLLQEIRSSLNEGKPMRTSKLIHSLKSSVKLICIDELFNDIFELETKALAIDRP